MWLRASKTNVLRHWREIQDGRVRGDYQEGRILYSTGKLWVWVDAKTFIQLLPEKEQPAAKEWFAAQAKRECDLLESEDGGQ